MKDLEVQENEVHDIKKDGYEDFSCGYRDKQGRWP